jgi:hypothetical protein
VSPAGTTLVDLATLPQVRTTLLARDAAAFTASLASAGLQAVVIDSRPRGLALPAHSVAAMLASYAHVAGLTGVYVGPLGALYQLDPIRDWSPQLCAALADVARRLLGGAPEPRLTSFPEAVRRVEPVEVMVLLRSERRARLWRSARGSSFARALVTAADVARKRWNEREQAMGGPLDQVLPTLSVEVALLQDDGELGARDPGFVDRVVGPVHGVAYEHKGAWRYALPEATHRPTAMTASGAYRRLFKEDGLSEDSLGSPELRLYRMVVRSIGVSEPSAGHDPVFEVGVPAEVLGK